LSSDKINYLFLFESRLTAFLVWKIFVRDLEEMLK
jgi:hypothetical protein